MRIFLLPFQKPGRIFQRSSQEFIKACQDLKWAHDTNTHHRSEAKGLAERAVGRVKKGTTTVMFQSGLPEEWCDCAMKCCCYLLTRRDKLADGKTGDSTRSANAVKTNLFLGRVSVAPVRKENVDWSIRGLCLTCGVRMRGLGKSSSKYSSTKKFHKDGTLSLPCADGSLKHIDLSRPHHGGRPNDGKDEEEATSFEEENKNFDLTYRHHEVYPSTLCVPSEETFFTPRSR